MDSESGGEEEERKTVSKPCTCRRRSEVTEASSEPLKDMCGMCQLTAVSQLVSQSVKQSISQTDSHLGSRSVAVRQPIRIE